MQLDISFQTAMNKKTYLNVQPVEEQQKAILKLSPRQLFPSPINIEVSNFMWKYTVIEIKLFYTKD